MTVFVATPGNTEEPNTTHESYSRYVARHFVPPLQEINAKQAHCLAQAIYYEAGNQPVQGKEAVAIVIINRANHERYPRTICGVVRQSHVIKVNDREDEDVSVRRVCQFSFWCERLSSPSGILWRESVEIANRVLKNYWERDIIVSLDTALYFHADYVSPKWRKEKKFLTKIGNHLFYGERLKTA